VGPLCWDELPHIKAATANASYKFMAQTEYDRLVLDRPLEAIAIYWKETLERIHLGSCSALLRHEQWLQGMLIAADDGCYFPFIASFRGLLESAADSTYSLASAPYFLADNLPQIISHLKMRKTKDLIASYQLEERLIHFSHARRLAKGETADPVHAAKQISDYLKTFTDAGINARELYSELCKITHPSAESVALWYSPGDENGSIWKRAGSPDLDSIKGFMGLWRETNEAVFTLVFVPLFFNLRILHKIDFLPKIPQLKQFPFSNFQTWNRIKKAIYT
jgi:hypothetical protein